MDLKVNDEVLVDGVRAKIECIFAAGRHVRYILSDGREYLDLHLNQYVRKVDDNPKLRKSFPEVTTMPDELKQPMVPFKHSYRKD